MRRTFTRLIGMVCLLLFVTSAFAQNITVKGKVTDAKTGETLPGVSVTLKGTTTGTVTDVNGQFSVSAPGTGTLVLSYIGFQNKEVAVNNQTTLNVTLQSAATELEQVVVVGYGTQRKVDITGSVAQVKGEEISKQASINPVGALQGKVAGVQITNSGSPGASPQIKIRGTGTIFGNTNILYVVDGVWYDDISFLNPADIADMSILKDASSTAIYGIRAANGVVLVTTKKGKLGKPVINYTGYAGWQAVTNPVAIANGPEYAQLVNELRVANGGDALLNPSQFDAGTDWYKEVLRDAAVMNHQVSISGGTENTTYNFSFGYLDQNGNVETNNYKRYTARLANDFKINKNIKVGYNVSAVYSKSKDIPTGIFTQLYSAAPIIPVFNADGSYGDPNSFNLGDANNYNPQATIDFYNQRSQNYRYNGNVFGELDFLKHLKFRSSFGGDIGQGEVRNYTPVYYATLRQQNAQSVLNVKRAENRNWIIENTLTYTNKFDKHNLTVLLGQTAQRYKSYSLDATGRDVPMTSNDDYYLSLGSVGNFLVSDAGTLNTVASYFARVNYAFADRYLLNASIRADGASQFFGNDLYGYFPSVGAGWVITNEPFMKDQKVFSNLKLRGSWGKVGNAGVPINPTIQQVTQVPEYTAIFGVDQLPYTGRNISTAVPPSIRWERGVGTDIGLEMGFLDNRLSFEADVYDRTTKLAIFPIPVLGNIGLSPSTVNGNQADIQNRGYELAASWRASTSKDFTYSISANVGYNQNKVTNVVTGNNPIYSGGAGITNGNLTNRTVLGQPIGQFFGYKVAGVFQTAAEVAASAQPTAKPGDFRMVDQNGDGQIDGLDRVVLGNPNPRYSYGFNTNFAYKNIDLTLDFQGVAGVEIYNANLGFRFGNENFTQDFFNNRWRGPGTSNTYPSANIGSNDNSRPNSFFVENGSYFRVRNMQLGYTLPTQLLTKLKIQKIRIYANAQNALNFFSYRGFSPEIQSQNGSPLNAGIDSSVYPQYATYNFGLNVTF